MTSRKAELTQRLSRFREGLKLAGLKATRQRPEVFREIAAADHPDAERRAS